VRIPYFASYVCQSSSTDGQCAINDALSINTGCDCEINGDGTVNAIDVQLVINTALGIAT